MLTASKKILSWSIKIAIVLLALYFVYQRILKNDANIRQFKRLVTHIDLVTVFFYLGIIVMLMLVNWGLESFKWQFLTKKISLISYWTAVETVFCGLTWAIFTPNRFGEYGGRVMFLPNRKRIHGVFAMGVGAFGQNVVTNVMGAAGIVWFTFTCLHITGWLMLLILVVAVIYCACFLVLFFKIKWLVVLLNKIPFLAKYHRFFAIMGKYRREDLITVMCFSLSRYLVFTLQYFLLIHLLIPPIPAFGFMMMLFVFFFVQSAIPSLDFLDIGVRSLAADKLFGYLTNQHIAIIASVSIIYLINLIIPAIFGSVFVFKLKFFDRSV